MKNAILILLLISACNIHAQIRVPKIGKKSGTENKGKVEKTTEKKSPAESDIRMAEMYMKELNSMLNEGDFNDFGKLETRIPSKMKDFKERISKIEEVDPNYNTSEYHAEYQKFEEAYEQGMNEHEGVVADKKARKDSIAEANTPEKTMLRNIDSWAHYISFSNKPIDSESPVVLQSSFTSGDMIYGRAYFKKPVSEVFSRDKYLASFEVDGKEIFTDDVAFRSEAGENYVDIQIVKPDTRRVNRLRALNQLSLGTHKVTIYFGDYVGLRTKIIGEFKLTVTDDGKKKWQEIIDAYEMRRVGENEPPKEGMKNPALCSEAIKFYKEKGYNGNPYKAYVDTDEWIINKDGFGNITSRSADVVVWIKINAEVCEYSIISVKQDYNGGKYGISYFNGIGTTKKVLCSKVK